MILIKKIEKNQKNKAKLESNKIKICSLSEEFWGRERCVIIIYNPERAKRQESIFKNNVSFQSIF